MFIASKIDNGLSPWYLQSQVFSTFLQNCKGYRVRQPGQTQTCRVPVSQHVLSMCTALTRTSFLKVQVSVLLFSLVTGFLCGKWLVEKPEVELNDYWMLWEGEGKSLSLHSTYIHYSRPSFSLCVAWYSKFDALAVFRSFSFALNKNRLKHV